jgi:hypothetical protein
VSGGEGAAEVYTRPVAYDVSVFPDEIRDEPKFYGEPEHWVVHVEWRGRGTWAEDDWLAAHRFALDDALVLAREHAPKVRVNGHSAVDVLARYRDRLAGP